MLTMECSFCLEYLLKIYFFISYFSLFENIKELLFYKIIYFLLIVFGYNMMRKVVKLMIEIIMVVLMVAFMAVIAIMLMIVVIIVE